MFNQFKIPAMKYTFKMNKNYTNSSNDKKIMQPLGCRMNIILVIKSNYYYEY